jgi:integrase
MQKTPQNRAVFVWFKLPMLGPFWLIENRTRLRRSDKCDTVNLDRCRKSTGTAGELEVGKELERCLTYKLAVLTGLRRGEIESLTMDHLHLDSSMPVLRMKPQDQEPGSGKRSTFPCVATWSTI